MANTRRETGLFFGLLVLLTGIILFLIIQQDSFMRGNKILGIVLMWIPGLAAILTLLISRQGLQSIGWRIGPLKYLFLGYSLPIAYTLAGYLVMLFLGAIQLNPSKLTPKMAIMFLLGPIINIIAALGEEIGWRGFLLPNLYQKYSFTKTSLIIGVVWAAWHFPLIGFTDFYSGNSPWLAIASFTVSTVSITFIYNWLWLASKSVWPVTLLHAVNNFYALNIHHVFHISNQKVEALLSDFGLLTPLISTALALIALKWAKRLPSSKPPRNEVLSP